MSQTINTNVASLNSQRQLNKSQSSLNTALERLSSGLRINSAKDDAAGLAISDRMTAQINGMDQAVRNANDGISLMQTAESALGSITDNLQRVRELAVQASNATNSASDRASINDEATQLIAEITRVASQTQFNGINLLDGTFSAKAFQVGANNGQTITVSSITDSRATNLGSSILDAAGSIIGAGGVGAAKAPAAALTGGNLVAIESDLTIQTNKGTTSSISYDALSDAKGIAAAINDKAGAVGVKATASNSATLSIGGAGDVSFNLIGGTELTGGSVISVTIADSTDLTDLMGAINAAQASTGITASFSSTSSKSELTLSTTDGRDIGLLNFNTDAATDTATFFGVTLDVSANTDSSIKSGTVELNSSEGTIKLANANTDVFSSASQESIFSSVSSLSLSTAANAQKAILTVDAALAQVDTARGSLGAYQNRFTSVVSNLQANSENASSSRGRILDADFAQETSNMSKSNILQQAGTAMLAQANQSAQNVLSLLK